MAQVTVHEYSALADVFRRGLLGFAEAYMDERVDTDDLPGLLQWGERINRPGSITRWPEPPFHYARCDSASIPSGVTRES